MKNLMRIALLVLVIAALTACGGSGANEPTAAPAAPEVATATEQPTAAPAAPTATAKPAPTEAPTVAPTPTEAAAPTDTPEPTATTEPTRAPAAASGMSGDCSNPFFPVVEGASWTYDMTGTGASTYTRTITEVRDNGFTMTNATDGSDTPLSIDYECGENGLSSATLGGLPGAAGAFSFSVTNFTGTNFPPADQWKTGATWNASYTVEGGGTIQDIEATATGDVALTYEIVDQESVTVPAGTFDAYKVNSTLTQKLTMSMNGMTVPVEFTINSVDWYAKDVGQVKSMTLGDFANTSELVAYSGL